MSQYICRVCRKPLRDMAPLIKKMMELFEMPLDGGAHAECLAEISQGSGERKASKQASPSPSEKRNKT